MGTKVGPRRARRAAVIAGALLVAALGLAGVRATVQDDAGDSGQRTIDLDDATPIRISPDGRLLAVERDRRLCVYEVDAAEERVCSEEFASIHLAGVAWSPDGTRLAFTEDGARRLDESDLWVMDAETGEAINLTDDGFNQVEPGAATPRDLLPAWSPDGTEIAFARETGETTHIYRLPAAGGDPVAVQTVMARAGAPYRSVRSLHWSPTPAGDRLLYLLDGGLGRPETGLWATAPDGGEPVLLLQVDAQQSASVDPPLPAFAQVAHVAPNGDALVFTGGHDQPGFAIVRLPGATGTVEPMREAPAAGEPTGPEDNPNPLMAALSSDGSRLLYVTVGGALILRDADGSENVLAADLDVVPGSPLLDLGPALAWLADGTVYVPLTGGQALLLDVATR